MTAYLSVADAPALAVHVHVPRVGPWFADCDLADDAPNVQGRVTVRIGDAAFVGTVQSPRDGVFGLQRRCRVVGGAGGWCRELARLAYHNDAGVKGSQVAQEAATAVGESLPDATALKGVRLGNDYVREAGVASRVIEDACRGVPWWVGYDGVTRVGDRTPPAPTAEDYSVITHNPRHGDVELAVDDVTKVGVGSVLAAHLDAPLAVTSLEIAATASSLRVHAWCGSGERSALADTLRAIVERCTDGLLHGVWRYRVVSMNGDRVNLQRCGARKDLPDLLACPMWPGVSGTHAQLARGTEVSVQFLDGDRAQPIITGFVGRGGPGDIPDDLTLGGPNGAAPVACLGDIVNVFFPPTIPIAGLISGVTPFAGTITLVNPAIGNIQSGRPHVRAGNGR